MGKKLTTFITKGTRKNKKGLDVIKAKRTSVFHKALGGKGGGSKTFVQKSMGLKKRKYAPRFTKSLAPKKKFSEAYK